MQEFRADDLLISPDTTKPGLVRLDWTGKSNARDPGKLLRPYFDLLLNTAAQDKRSVEMHFEKLEYFNSSTIAAIIQLINSAQQKNVKLNLVYDSKLRWQTLSFDGLKRAVTPFTTAESTAISFRAI